MSINTQLGIWMDHSEAHLLSLKSDIVSTSIIQNDFDHADMEEALDKGESLMHNKRQQQQAVYYKNLQDVISPYNEVLLFGPTNAKVELLNLLLGDLRFVKTIIKVETTDNMTDNQKQAFVKDHFSK